MSDTPHPLISVIMTVYNGEKFVDDAMEGILKQTYGDFELILIDDGSNDKTPEILDRYFDPRIIRIRNDRNIGLTASINKGIKLAKGEFIARHDADDVSLPDRLMEQIERFSAEPSLVLLGASYYVIDHNGQIIESAILPSTNAVLQASLETSTVFLHGTIMVRRSVLENVGGYREIFPVSQDYDLFLRLAEQGEIANLSKPLYLFRFHQSSVSREKKRLQLAYARMAWEFACRRRANQSEGAVPEDVINSFPPDPSKLFSEARYTAYLYYAAGQLDQAEVSVNRALQLQYSDEKNEKEWRVWVLSQAIHLANFRGNFAEGEDFLKWSIDQLNRNGLRLRAKSVLGEYFVDRAFKAYQMQNLSEVRACALRALSSDRRCLRNRGFWAIALKSMG